MDKTMSHRSFAEIATRWHEGTKCAVSTSKTSPYYTALHPEDGHLHARRRDNLKSYILNDAYMYITSVAP
jgi:hypothetical protein